MILTYFIIGVRVFAIVGSGSLLRFEIQGVALAT